MGKHRNGSLSGKPGDPESPTGSDRSRRSKHRKVDSDVSGSSDEDDRTRSKRKHSRRRSRRRDDSASSEYSESDSSGSESDVSASREEDESSESEDEIRRRKRKEKRRREREREYEKERRRRKEKQRKRREKEEREERRKKRKKEDKKKKKKEKKMGAVTNSWGKYGIIRETDMWNKRPEFTAWLAEVKQVNLEHLSNWEEKLMFKEFMEDHNTATFPSKKYYDLDAYHQHKMVKELKRGSKKAEETERTVFNDEEQRRQELLIERERFKEEKVEALKSAMQSGMAQAMKEQAQLREEMAYQYRLGNFEAAAAIQKRLDPDVAL